MGGKQQRINQQLILAIIDNPLIARNLNIKGIAVSDYDIQ